MKIMEVSQNYGISSDTLRYYERIGLIPPVHRNGSGIRDYNELDLRRVEFIKCMRRAGLPVQVLIDTACADVSAWSSRATRPLKSEKRS